MRIALALLLSLAIVMPAGAQSRQRDKLDDDRDACVKNSEIAHLRLKAGRPRKFDPGFGHCEALYRQWEVRSEAERDAAIARLLKENAADARAAEEIKALHPAEITTTKIIEIREKHRSRAAQ